MHEETLPELLPLDAQKASLSGTAITSILRETKPSCTKAQTWIEAQRASDQDRARAAYRAMRELSTKVQSRQHVRLEKVAALRLARKAREMRMRLAADGARDGDGVSQGREKLLSSREKVQQANIRLQKALRAAHWD